MTGEMMDFRDFKELMRDLSKYIITIIVILFLLIYVFSLQQVVGPSMNETLQDQDVMILLKSHYRLFPVERNDIIAFKYEDTKYLVKRVIGLPGENIEYKDNILYINGEVVEDKYANGNTGDFKLNYDKIPEDKYLVLGDNRENSVDSREIGLIDKKDIMGKVKVRIWPLNKIRVF